MSSQQKKIFRMSLSSNLQAQESEKQQNSYLKLSRANLMASDLNNFDNVSINGSIADDNVSELSFKDLSTSNRSNLKQNKMNLFNNTSSSSVSKSINDNDSVISSQFESSIQKPLDNEIPKDIKRFLLSFQGSKQDKQYRTKYHIPNNFHA